nr:MAG TPA: hypothetical protein [Caudoviricetes sp.]
MFTALYLAIKFHFHEHTSKIENELKIHKLQINNSFPNVL